MDELTYGPMVQWSNSPMVQSTNGPMDQWTNGPSDQWFNGPINQWTIGPMDQWPNGPMAQWTDGPINGPIYQCTNGPLDPSLRATRLKKLLLPYKKKKKNFIGRHRFSKSQKVACLTGYILAHHHSKSSCWS